jgi:hypothetical protein
MVETAKYADVICFQALPFELRRAFGALIAIPLVDSGISELELTLIANKRRSLSTAAATFAAQLSLAMREGSPGMRMPP